MGGPRRSLSQSQRAAVDNTGTLKNILHARQPVQGVPLEPRWSCPLEQAFPAILQFLIRCESRRPLLGISFVGSDLGQEIEPSPRPGPHLVCVGARTVLVALKDEFSRIGLSRRDRLPKRNSEHRAMAARAKHSSCCHVRAFWAATRMM